jgi:hypothetical protein
MKSANKTKAAGVMILATWLAGACTGNYSNEDVDFQLALPETDDLTVKLPRQALISPDAAEYYLATREVVFKVNAFVFAVTGIVDSVRAFAPSERHGDLRVWGPFPHDRDRTFELRMSMLRVADAAGRRFDYRIEFHRVGDAQAPWTPLITGVFLPVSPTETRLNQIVLDLTEARKQGYPVSDFNELEELRIAYQRRAVPYRTTVTVRNVKEAQVPGAAYEYSENIDHSGEMTFTWRVAGNPVVMAVELFSRWLGTGAGRADARIVEGLGVIAGTRGIDCWGPDARATYTRRDWADRREEGDPATCVFPAPVTSP